MADLLKCMECGGMVSSEAYKCPHCNTGSDGIRGVNCTICGGFLKFSEARHIKLGEYSKSQFFHNSCYQKISQTVEKKKTINCPVCTQPNLFSNADPRSRLHYSERINCAKCGHPYEYQQTKENDPYTECMYCGFLLEKNLEVLVFKSDYHDSPDYYSHKLCDTNERQAQRLKNQEYHENSRHKIEEQSRLKKKKEADEKFESKLRGALLPGLFMGGLSLAMGVWAILLFGILFGLYFIIDWE